jgi:hypothetical protein
LCQCSDCQAAFAKVTPRNQGAPSQQHLFISFEDSCVMCNEVIEKGNGYLCVTCEMAGFTCLMCATCATTPAIKERHCREAPSSQGHHHEFVQDTLDNLWGVFGAQLLRDGVVDRDAKEWMLENWNHGSTKEVILDLLRESAFGARSVVVAAPDNAALDPVEQPASKKRPREEEDSDDTKK